MLACFSIFAQTDHSQPDENTIIVNDAPEMEVYSFGKNVIIKKEAKGVLVFGGDVTIEGKVTGDVATIGGSIIQKKDAFIGGDVIIFGGTYRPESKIRFVIKEKKHYVCGVMKKKFANLRKIRRRIFSPTFTWSIFCPTPFIHSFLVYYFNGSNDDRAGCGRPFGSKISTNRI